MSALFKRNCQLNDDEINKVRSRTINVMYFTMFTGCVSFSIVMTSMWPFLRELDGDVTTTFLGYANAGYSLAQLISSLLFGYWSDRRSSIEPLLLSIFLLAFGSGLYAYAEAFGKLGIWVVLCARILLGFSAGNISTVRAVAAHLSTSENLSKVMSLIALWQIVGFLVGPAFQAASKPVGTEGIYVPSIRLYFNIYTAPCYFLILLSIINLALVMKYFVEDIGDLKCKRKSEEEKVKTESESLEPFDRLPLAICLIVHFVCMSIFALNETIVSPMMMDLFAWSRDTTVFYGAIFMAANGVISIFCFLGIYPMAKRFNNKILIVVGYLMMFTGFILYLPWGPGDLKMKMADLTYPNGTTIPTKDDDRGCPYQYKWCHDTPQLPLPQYLVAALLVGIGYPIVAVLIGVVYSKIIGPFPQGLYMGWLSGIGSLARVVGPIYVTYMYQHLGIRWTSACTAFIIAFAVILFCIFWKRIITYDEKNGIKSDAPVIA